MAHDKIRSDFRYDSVPSMRCKGSLSSSTVRARWVEAALDVWNHDLTAQCQDFEMKTALQSNST